MTENKSKIEIKITIEGGVIQWVDIPKGSNIEVEILDYDVEDYDEDCEDMHTDKNGDQYHSAVWGQSEEE